MTRIRLNVNGDDRVVDVAPGTFLLEVLRDVLELTGTKMCCVEGECGACTVILDGSSVNSCLVLAHEAEGAGVTTVEGLGGGRLHRLQEAFLDNAAAQCGFCIPGQLMAAEALLNRNSNPTRSDVREALAGNLCRCGGYEQITDAVLDAAKGIP